MFGRGDRRLAEPGPTVTGSLTPLTKRGSMPTCDCTSGRRPEIGQCSVHRDEARGLPGTELEAQHFESGINVCPRPDLDDERQHPPGHLGLGCLHSKGVRNRQCNQILTLPGSEVERDCGVVLPYREPGKVPLTPERLAKPPAVAEVVPGQGKAEWWVRQSGFEPLPGIERVAEGGAYLHLIRRDVGIRQNRDAVRWHGPRLVGTPVLADGRSTDIWTCEMCQLTYDGSVPPDPSPSGATW